MKLRECRSESLVAQRISQMVKDYKTIGLTD